MELILPISLFILGLIAIIIELFVPAGGVIGFVGFGIIFSSVVLSYVKYGIVTGTIFLFSSIIFLPILIGLAFKIFPHTFAGKVFILKYFQKKEDGFTSHNEENYTVLLNKEGVAITPLHPIGLAIINNKKFDVTTNGEFIDKEDKIKVVKVEGNKIVVRKV